MVKQKKHKKSCTGKQRTKQTDNETTLTAM